MRKKQAPGCFKTFIIGVGCFAVYSVMSVVLIAFLGYVFFAYPYKMISEPINLPEFTLPEENDYLSLQEKLIDAKSNDSKELTLSLAEYNAYLSKIQTQISLGYYLQKVRFNIEQNRPVLYVFGSGFTKRELNIKIQFSSTLPFRVEQVCWNKYAVPPDGVTKYISDYLLESIVKAEVKNNIYEVVYNNFPQIVNGGIKIQNLAIK